MLLQNLSAYKILQNFFKIVYDLIYESDGDFCNNKTNIFSINNSKYYYLTVVFSIISITFFVFD